MCKRTLCLICLVVVLSLGTAVQAATVTWVGDAPDQLWSTPTYWDNGAVPTAADVVLIKTSPGPIVANEGAIAKNTRVGASGGDDATLTVDGGTLQLDQWSAIGAWPESAQGTVNMISGTIDCRNELVVGNQGSGIINMIGGTMMVTFNLKIGREPTGVGHIDLKGGTLTANNLLMREEAGSVGTMDVGGGALILNGNDVSTVQGYIDNGWITAYGGNGTLQLDYDVTNEGQTTLRATHYLEPNPVDSSLVSAGDVELSWILPDPCVPGQPVPVDVYVTDDYDALYYFTDPAAIQVLNQQNVSSVTVQTQLKTRYYWAVDTYVGSPDDPVLGPIFSFTADNLAPEVDAGANVASWLVDGVRTRTLSGTVTDDGLLESATTTWTVISEPDDPNSPDAAIVDPGAATTSITLSAIGEYVIHLDAFDGEFTGSDTITINVYADSCEAAKALPDYEPLVGDLNGDCKVDELDEALMLENWLKDISLTDEVELD